MSSPLFLPTLEGQSPVVHAHLGRDQGPPLFDWHPQIFIHLQYGLYVEHLPRYLSTSLMCLTCMGPVPVPPRRPPRISRLIRPRLPRPHETALTVTVCWQRAWAGGLGRTNRYEGRANYRV